jgi:WD40-like Beta Propeller Repeat
MRMSSRETLSFAAVLLVTLWGSPAAAADVGPLALPDNRAWEQVSPVDKNGNDVGYGSPMAAIDGNRLLYSSPGPFAGAESAIADGIRYMATRTPSGWTTVSLMPPGGTFTLGWNGYQGFTEDLSKGVVAWQEDEITGTVDPEAPFGFNLYMRDTATGSFQLLNGPLAPVNQGYGFVWGSKDFSKLAIGASTALTPDSPCSAKELECAYEWDDGEIRLASILPNGAPATGRVGSNPGNNYEHAMSDDGRRLFFTSAAGGGGMQLYVREDGTGTTLISASERTLPGGSSGGALWYQSAEAAHGGRVAFTTQNALVDADADASNDLYLYDFTKPEGGRLTLVSEDHNTEVPGGADVDTGYHSLGGGLLGAGEDLRRIYFVANNQILAGEPTGPGAKLYLWDDTGAAPELTYVATLNDEGGSTDTDDNFAWSAPTLSRDFVRQAQVSPDGRFVVFRSWAKLTESALAGRQEIYRYDAVAHSLECISCSAEQFPPEPNEFADQGDLQFALLYQATKPWNHLPRNVTDDGRVFFQTSRGLVPRDSNGKFDVYEYEDGQLYLISSGTGGQNSLFLDATPSGSDVFFITADRLVGWDIDRNYDVYDARVGGGLPEPPPAPPPCEGDSCQPPPLLRARPSLASASFEGPGNASTRKRRRCGAGKVRRQGKCRKKARQGKRSGAKGGSR